MKSVFVTLLWISVLSELAPSVVHADDKFTTFLEFERAICLRLLSEQIKS